MAVLFIFAFYLEFMNQNIVTTATTASTLAAGCKRLVWK
jgi:hypothetical protein